ncbi:MAG: hypothetical protein FJW53_07290 [Actinobacteria bacterium]|nr:hypothetical protein [Actinomycetota bacterium]
MSDDFLEGSVVSFDDPTGLGTVLLDDGSRVPFHCVSIADGTRSIDAGTRVRVRLAFRVVRVEAVDINRL